MALPNPGMDFTAFDTLPASQLDDLVENIESLAAGTGFSNDAIPASAINFTGLWGEEIGRTTLVAASNTITTPALPNMKYLNIVVYAIDTGGTIDVWLRFNSDASTNYSFIRSVNGGAESPSTSSSAIVVVSAIGSPSTSYVNLTNIVSQNKIAYCTSIARGIAGAANLPLRAEGCGKWAGSPVISTVSAVNGSGSGQFAIGSQIIVYGAN